MTDNPDERRYEARVDRELAGFTTYRARPAWIALNHTEVDDDFEGRGVGSELVRRVLDDARSKELDVLPFCPFVSSYIARHEEYLDLVPQARREEFGL